MAGRVFVGVGTTRGVAVGAIAVKVARTLLSTVAEISRVGSGVWVGETRGEPPDEHAVSSNATRNAAGRTKRTFRTSNRPVQTWAMSWLLEGCVIRGATEPYATAWSLLCGARTGRCRLSSAE